MDIILNKWYFIRHGFHFDTCQNMNLSAEHVIDSPSKTDVDSMLLFQCWKKFHSEWKYNMNPISDSNVVSMLKADVDSMSWFQHIQRWKKFHSEWKYNVNPMSESYVVSTSIQPFLPTGFIPSLISSYLPIFFTPPRHVSDSHLLLTISCGILKNLSRTATRATFKTGIN